MQNQPTTNVPDWDKISLPDEYRTDLLRLQQLEDKLKRVTALGNAIIHYMRSECYADTEGVHLEGAFYDVWQSQLR
jgi:hypothetical protein